MATYGGVKNEPGSYFTLHIKFTSRQIPESSRAWKEGEKGMNVIFSRPIQR